MALARFDLDDLGLPYPEGSQYEGEAAIPGPHSEATRRGLKDAKLPNGKGTVRTPDGQTYVGTFVDGLAHGKCTWTDKKAQQYIGQWYGGKKHGQGAMQWENGDVYVGSYHGGGQILGSLQVF